MSCNSFFIYMYYLCIKYSIKKIFFSLKSKRCNFMAFSLWLFIFDILALFYWGNWEQFLYCNSFDLRNRLYLKNAIIKYWHIRLPDNTWLRDSDFLGLKPEKLSINSVPAKLFWKISDPNLSEKSRTFGYPIWNFG